MIRWLGEVFMDFYRQVKAHVYVHKYIDKVFKQFHKKLKIISDICISSIQGHTGRLIDPVTRALPDGSQCLFLKNALSSGLLKGFLLL